jgi:hypothetical protein
MKIGNPKKRSKRRIRIPKHKTKGGAAMIPGQPSAIKVIGTMIAYGLSSVIIAPIFFLAEILNIPISNFNNLARKAFDDKNESFLHLPFYKLITGCPVKTMSPSDFVLQEDMHLHKNVAVVSCDKESKSDVKEHTTSLSDSFLDMIGLISKKRKLRHNVYLLFQYIDSLRETDEERKKKIKLMVKSISNYRVLIKCYLITRTIQCSTVKHRKETILADEDIVQVVNPLYYPMFTTYTKRVSCMWKHMTKKRFTQEEKEECSAPCETCTFNHSARRITKKYLSVFSGSRLSALSAMFNTYYSYLTVVKENVPLPENEEGVLKYLNTIKVSSDIKDKLEKEDSEEVLSLVNRFICKYDIASTLEEEIKAKVKNQLMKGYSMEQILDFI